ncbi:DUF917 domain-containing protein [Fusibacter sp. 3D3]|uniref:DUF917 domain-containing protein n=1 Tax=Fusibacter sp. 3D3 TaxID=1048380 RepID=UPI000853A53E|nr:DUF917 domain-containing protein [Fusibacter sp. 3D3]GAU79930.1 conservative hypothetical protein [Fusibacter sp. 3D3]
MNQLTPIKRLVTKKDFEYIVMGGALFGSGGGGPVAAGMQIIQDILSYNKPVEIIQVKDLAEERNQSGAVVAFMGSPSAGAGGIDLETPTNAFNALCNFKPLTYAMLIELGGGNSVVPMSVAVRKNIPIVDGDGAGRAVPKIQNTTYAQVISPSPAALSNGKQSGLPTVDNIILLKDLEPDEMADALEAYCLEILSMPTFGQMGGLATYMMDSNDLPNAIISGTLTLSYYAGKAIVDALDSKVDPVPRVVELLTDQGKACYTFGIAQITQIIKPTDADADLDLGKVILEDSKGNTMILDYENENLFATLNGEIWAMAPDSICYIGNQGAMSNVEIQVGDQVTILGISADAKMRVKSIVNSFMHELKVLNVYDGAYITIEVLHKS